MLSFHPVIEYLLMLSLQSFPIKKKILKKEEKIILKNWKALWSEIYLTFFLTFNTVNVLKLVHSISSASTYSVHEELFYIYNYDSAFALSTQCDIACFENH